MAEVVTTANERYVLSCILNNPESVWDVGSVLNIKDFSLDANKYIFALCRKLIEDGTELDEATLENGFNEEVRKIIEKVSPDETVISYLRALKESPHSMKNLHYNIDAIKKGSVIRQLAKEFDSLKVELVNDSSDKSVAEIVSHCEDRIVDLGVANESLASSHQIAEGLRSFVEERAKFPAEVPGIRTGYTRLDKEFGGLKGGQLTVVVARPKVGKTSLLLNWAKHIAIDQKVPLLMLDTEMETSEVNTRLLSILSDVEERKIVSGLYIKEEEEKNKVYKALSLLEEAPLYHIYMPEWDFDTILAYTRKYKVRYNIGALFFDYIKLPDGTDLRSAQEYIHLGQLTTNLKNKIAGKLDIPVVTAGQLNRLNVGADSVDTNQIAGSDRILHFCNHMLALTKKSFEEQDKCDNKSNLSLTLLASRNANSGSVFDLYFRKPRLQMYEVGGTIEAEESWDEY